MPNSCSFFFQDQSGGRYTTSRVVISQTALLQAKIQREKAVEIPPEPSIFLTGGIPSWENPMGAELALWMFSECTTNIFYFPLWK